MIGREPSQSISQNGRIEIHEQTASIIGQARQKVVRQPLDSKRSFDPDHEPLVQCLVGDLIGTRNAHRASIVD